MSLNPDLNALFSRPRSHAGSSASAVQLNALLSNQNQLGQGNLLQFSAAALFSRTGTQHAAVRTAGRELALINSRLDSVLPNLQLPDIRGRNGALGFGDEKNPFKGYRDYSKVPDDEDESKLFGGADSAARTANGANFPMKLHEILSREEFSSIIAWAPHGRSWRVLKPKTFESKVLPQFFRHGKYNSFTRQVNGWGFRRITQGPDHNTYYHEFFLRGLPHLCKKMRRMTASSCSKVSETGVKVPEPDFYKISELNPLPEHGPAVVPSVTESGSSLRETYDTKTETERALENQLELQQIKNEILQNRLADSTLASLVHNRAEPTTSLAASLSALEEARLASVQRLVAADRSRRVAAQDLLNPYSRGLGAQCLQNEALLRMHLEAASSNAMRERESLLSAVRREHLLCQQRANPSAVERLLLLQALNGNQRGGNLR